MKVNILKNPENGTVSLYFPEIQQLVEHDGTVIGVSIRRINEFTCMLEDNDLSHEAHQMILAYQEQQAKILYPKRVRTRVFKLVSIADADINKEINLSGDFWDYIDLEDLLEDEDDADAVYNSISDALNDKNAFDHEVIYYLSAMEYLMKEDVTLQESLEIANDFGFSLDKLSSEVLASLLKSRRAQEEWCENKSQIISILEQLIEDYPLAKAKDLIEEECDWEIAELIDDIWMDLEAIESNVTYKQYVFIKETLESFQ